jgi:hypothetical protein
MLDFVWSFLGGFVSQHVKTFLLLAVGFVTGALMFRNNPVTGESYAQKFISIVSMIFTALVNLKNKLLNRS